MKIVSFIERCQDDVIEQILRHCGLWEGPLCTNASARAPSDGSHRVSAEPSDPQFIPDPEYVESESRESESRKSRADATRELQLVLDDAMNICVVHQQGDDSATMRQENKGNWLTDVRILLNYCSP